jgi:hypothetical protein
MAERNTRIELTDSQLLLACKNEERANQVRRGNEPQDNTFYLLLVRRLKSWLNG